MAVVDQSHPYLRVAQMTLCLLLAIVALLHVAQALTSPVPETAAGCAGAAVAYAVVAASVLLYQRLAYPAAVVLPLLSFLYSDHRLVDRATDPVEIVYLVMFAVIVPLGAFLWRATRAPSA